MINFSDQPTKEIQDAISNETPILVEIETPKANSGISTGRGTQVRDVKTGRRITGVYAVDLRIAVDEITTAKIEMHPAHIKATAQASFSLAKPQSDRSRNWAIGWGLCSGILVACGILLSAQV